MLCSLEDYNLTTVVHVWYLLMLLSATLLRHPPLHLTPCADYPALSSLLYSINVSQSCISPSPFSVSHTHLVNLGHATAVGHLGGRVKEHKIRILHVVTCVFVQNWTHSITPHGAH